MKISILVSSIIISCSIITSTYILSQKFNKQHKPIENFFSLSKNEQGKIRHAEVFKKDFVEGLIERGQIIKGKESEDFFENKKEKDPDILTIELYNGNDDITIEQFDVIVTIIHKAPLPNTQKKEVYKYRESTKIKPLSTSTVYVKCWSSPTCSIGDSYTTSINNILGRRSIPNIKTSAED